MQQNGTQSRPPAVLQEVRSQVPGKGTLRDLLLKLQIAELPEGQEQLNLQQCKTGMTGCWPEGLLIKNQMAS